jgi:glycosyltransferase involved in cell wall biosynthesis
MRDATLFVLPSRYEGLGCVYLEAMASGVPAVGCRGQGIEEVIRHRENGWLIEPGNLDDLVAAIRTLLADPHERERLGAAARRTILDGFNLEHQAQRLAAIYRGCHA